MGPLIAFFVWLGEQVALGIIVDKAKNFALRIWGDVKGGVFVIKVKTLAIKIWEEIKKRV